jgi:Uma2 family endonuclease
MREQRVSAHRLTPWQLATDAAAVSAQASRALWLAQVQKPWGDYDGFHQVFVNQRYEMGQPLPRMTLTEFMAWEADQATRHVFYRGETFGMVGGTRGHNRVVANRARHLGNHLEGTPCQVFSEAMKVQVFDEAVLYPDVLVTCAKQFKANELVVRAPELIIEVLSPSSQRHDRSEKFAIYRKLASLREYVLIDPETRRVEVFRPLPDGSCTYLDTSDSGQLRLSSVDCGLPLEWVFKGMDSTEA